MTKCEDIQYSLSALCVASVRCIVLARLSPGWSSAGGLTALGAAQVQTSDGILVCCSQSQPSPSWELFITGEGGRDFWGRAKSLFSFVIKCFLMKLSVSIKITFFFPFLN